MCLMLHSVFACTCEAHRHQRAPATTQPARVRNVCSDAIGSRKDKQMVLLWCCCVCVCVCVSVGALFYQQGHVAFIVLDALVFYEQGGPICTIGKQAYSAQMPDVSM